MIEYDKWLKFGGKNLAYRISLPEKPILEEFKFDKRRYARFLFEGTGRCETLLQYFVCISRDFDPIVILSFTQNQLIERLSEKVVTLFCQRGPLPRWNGRDNFYFDPAGHQPSSVLATKASEIIQFGVPDSDAIQASSKFRARYDVMAKK